MAIRRSRQLSIVRVAITAGMAQAAPEISGMVPFPLSPKGAHDSIHKKDHPAHIATFLQ